MLTLFFRPGPVRDYADARGARHRALRGASSAPRSTRGVYLAALAVRGRLHLARPRAAGGRDDDRRRVRRSSSARERAARSDRRRRPRPRAPSGRARCCRPPSAARSRPGRRFAATRFAPGLEAIYEGHLLHHGQPRLFAPADEAAALLLGDFLYARGLAWIAELRRRRGGRCARRPDRPDGPVARRGRYARRRGAVGRHRAAPGASAGRGRFAAAKDALRLDGDAASAGGARGRRRAGGGPALRRLAVVGAPSSAGAFAIGQERAPAALRAAGLLERLADAGLDVHDDGDGPVVPWRPDRQHPHAQNAALVTQAAERVRDRVELELAEGRVALVLGGDCTTGLGTVAGVRRALGDRLAVAYLDLHADLNTTASVPDGALDWTGNAHALALEDTVPELRRLAGGEPLLRAEQLVLVGHAEAAATPYEREVIGRLGIARLSVEEVADDPAAAGRRALELTGDRPLVVHFDVDVVHFTDAPLSENTGRKQGLRLTAALATLAALCASSRLAALTVSELNPDHAAADPACLAALVDGLAVALVAGERDAGEGDRHRPGHAATPHPERLPAIQPHDEARPGRRRARPRGEPGRQVARLRRRQGAPSGSRRRGQSSRRRRPRSRARSARAGGPPGRRRRPAPRARARCGGCSRRAARPRHAEPDRERAPGRLAWPGGRDVALSCRCRGFTPAFLLPFARVSRSGRARRQRCRSRARLFRARRRGVPEAPSAASRSGGSHVRPPRLGLVALGAALSLGAVPAQASQRPQALQQQLAAAAHEFDVPAGLLLAVAYDESRWDMHRGHPSAAGGYGVMHLTDLQGAIADSGKLDQLPPAAAFDPARHTLQTAARLIGATTVSVRLDARQNVRAGAALLASYERQLAGRLPVDAAAWYGAVARYSESPEPPRAAPVRRRRLRRAAQRRRPHDRPGPARAARAASTSRRSAATSPRAATRAATPAPSPTARRSTPATSFRPPTRSTTRPTSATTATTTSRRAPATASTSATS